MAEIIAVLCAATWVVLLSLRAAGRLGPHRGAFALAPVPGRHLQPVGEPVGTPAMSPDLGPLTVPSH